MILCNKCGKDCTFDHYTRLLEPSVWCPTCFGFNYLNYLEQLRTHTPQPPPTPEPMKSSKPPKKPSKMRWMEQRVAYWTRILPEDIAIRQASWELDEAIYLSRSYSGTTLRKIGKYLDRTIENIRQRGERHRRRVYWSAIHESPRLSPIEKYLDDPLVDIKLYIRRTQ